MLAALGAVVLCFRKPVDGGEMVRLALLLLRAIEPDLHLCPVGKERGGRQCLWEMEMVSVVMVTGEEMC